MNETITAIITVAAGVLIYFIALEMIEQISYKIGKGFFRAQTKHMRITQTVTHPVYRIKIEK